MKHAVWLLLSIPLAAQRPAVPEFVTGDQCLFCHRNDIGPVWGKNSHNLTVQQKEGSDDQFTLGVRTHHRNLKKSGYGKFAIEEKDGTWNQSKFADRCAAGLLAHAAALPACADAIEQKR